MMYLYFNENNAKLLNAKNENESIRKIYHCKNTILLSELNNNRLSVVALKEITIKELCKTGLVGNSNDNYFPFIMLKGKVPFKFDGNSYKSFYGNVEYSTTQMIKLFLLSKYELQEFDNDKLLLSMENEGFKRVFTHSSYNTYLLKESQSVFLFDSDDTKITVFIELVNDNIKSLEVQEYEK